MNWTNETPKPRKLWPRSAAVLCLLVGLLVGIVGMRLALPRSAESRPYNYIDRAYTVAHLEDTASYGR